MRSAHYSQHTYWIGYILIPSVTGPRTSILLPSATWHESHRVLYEYCILNVVLRIKTEARWPRTDPSQQPCLHPRVIDQDKDPGGWRTTLFYQTTCRARIQKDLWTRHRQFHALPEPQSRFVEPDFSLPSETQSICTYRRTTFSDCMRSSQCLWRELILHEV
jgi:hypothetical protein